MDNRFVVHKTIVEEYLKPYHKKWDIVSMDVIFQSACEFVEHFKNKVIEYEDSGRDDKNKPFMSQKHYLNDIANFIFKRVRAYDRIRREPVYEVYFVVAILMGIPDYHRSWWEENFSISLVDYLEKTTLFHNARPAILQALKDISAQNQYEIDFKTAGTLEPRIITKPKAKKVVKSNYDEAKPIISLKDDKREIRVYIDKVGQLCLGDFIETKIDKQ